MDGTLAQDDRPIAPAPAGELDLFALALLLRVNLRLILAFAFAGMLLAATFVLLVKPRYSATASVIIPQASLSSTSMALQAIGGGLDLVGGGNEIYVDLLRSEAVKQAIVTKFNLVDHYHVKDVGQAGYMLLNRTNFEATKEGLLTIVVQDENAQMAADIANSFVTELNALNLRLAITSASQQRRYFERELVKEKDALADAEVALQQGQEKTGIIEPQVQAQAGLSAAESTRAQLRARQVELDALLQGATAQNPQVIRLRAEIAGLEGELGAIRSGTAVASGMPVSKAPAAALAMVRNQREVKFHEVLFGILEREYETAKQQEAKDYTQLELLDPAVAPNKKSWPSRTLYTVLGLVAGAILGVLFTLAKAFFGAVLRNPENRARLEALKGRTPAAAR